MEDSREAQALPDAVEENQLFKHDVSKEKERKNVRIESIISSSSKLHMMSPIAKCFIKVKVPGPPVFSPLVCRVDERVES